MHYYKKNIGDYHKKAGRLTMLQHGAYTLLMDSCYDREKFPTFDDALDWCWASTEPEIEAVKFVLSKFFTLADGVYVQDRISDELDTYHKNAATNKRIAIERETKRKKKGTKRVPSVDEPPPNHEPLTTNQEPPKEKKATKRGARLSVEALPDEWETFCREERQDLHPHSVFSRFRDHWIAQPGQKGVKLDWLATWRNWVRNERQAPGSKAKRNNFNSTNYGEAGDL